MSHTLQESYLLNADKLWEIHYANDTLVYQVAHVT